MVAKARFQHICSHMKKSTSTICKGLAEGDVAEYQSTTSASTILAGSLVQTTKVQYDAFQVVLCNQ